MYFLESHSVSSQVSTALEKKKRNMRTISILFLLELSILDASENLFKRMIVPSSYWMTKIESTKEVDTNLECASLCLLDEVIYQYFLQK